MRKYYHFLVVLLLTSCAYSPQQIIINPVVTLQTNGYGQDRVIAVKVEDQRAEKAIGSRGGAYPDSSLITVSNDISAAIAEATVKGLQQQGFVVDRQQPAAAVLKVIIDSLHYENDKEAITAKVNLKAVLRIELVVAEKIYRGRYQSSSSELLITRPAAETNERLINRLLSQTLARALDDQKVKLFLSNS